MPKPTASQLYTYGKTFHTILGLLPYDFNYIQTVAGRKHWNEIE